MTSHPQVSVAICTLDRPHGLQLLLEAIDRQNLGAWPDDAVTILVIDNSVSGSVRALCTVRAEASRFRLVHVHEARRGLSFARNAALAASRDIGASHVAFVDDDEVPDPQWLSALHARLIETGATAAVGPVPAAQGEVKGRFADAVSVQTRPSPTDARPPAEVKAATGSPQSSDATAAAKKQLAQEEFRKFMDRQKRSSLYDKLPPAAADG